MFGRVAWRDREPDIRQAFWISRNGLAASVGLSRRQLERLFNEKAGMSPGQAYNKIKMERAKKLLMQTSSPMIEIALDVGFGDASHFTRCFKRVWGQTPTQVRASVREILCERPSRDDRIRPFANFPQ
ncbi:hypothetical protein B5P45_17740 [Phyllobacterium zundukense]|uniref:HTH araC/xylS-type domain-containing protein n=1 Tax=Phyllobacterium zundukense TaxID=1867719 RepID=A0A2N9VVH8_9HYPH|nr:hypothetical protein BLM14_25030 [Phyllobacterium zundukense]PIO43496.1 hypothetical protein B5P45_17740 [Phyllobacterium zundukense]